MGAVSLNEVYTYHAPRENQIERYKSIREAGKALALHIEMVTPQSREQSVALTNVQQAIMWANAAIAINE